jgi:uncharacterized protein (DUF433 family)
MNWIHCHFGFANNLDEIGETIMSPTMEIIVNNARDLDKYSGPALVEVSTALPEYRGGVTMTIQYVHRKDPAGEAHITVDPNIRGGVPCVGSGNWPISDILEWAASGISGPQMMQDNPGLTQADIQLALRAAAVVIDDPSIDWEEFDLPGTLALQQELKGWQALSAEAWNTIENPSED